MAPVYSVSVTPMLLKLQERYLQLSKGQLKKPILVPKVRSLLYLYSGIKRPFGNLIGCSPFWAVTPICAG